jgi:nitrite reductase/ring-hydroxylating ferredoxin subunit
MAPDLSAALDLVEESGRLDPWVDRLAVVAERLVGPRAIGNLLNGVRIGHPLHPALAQASVGLLMSATVLDIRSRGADRRAAQTLVLGGLLSAAPTVLAGLADWVHGHEQQRRVGLVHAALNVGGLTAYAASVGARRRGDGRVSSMVGLAALGTGAFVGGHLGYRQALGANHAEHVPHRAPAEWTRLCGLDELPQGELVQRMLGDQPLAVLRRGGTVTAVSDVCSHLSAPLHEGEVVDGCVVCPWHGSTFRLDDGSVARSPATAPLPVFEVQVVAGVVRVRLPGAG